MGDPDWEIRCFHGSDDDVMISGDAATWTLGTREAHLRLLVEDEACHPQDLDG